MCDIVAIKKSGPIVTFCLLDKSTVKYNLETMQCIGKKGLPVKNLRGQLAGITLGEVKEKFEDKDFFEFLKSVQSNTYTYTLAGALRYVSKYHILEGYARCGIKAMGSMYTEVGKIPAPMRQWYGNNTLNNYVITEEKITRWRKYEGIFQSILSQRCQSNKHSIDELIQYLLDYYSALSDSGAFGRLISQYHYKVTALTNYCCEINMYEGLCMSDVAHNLCDYNRMQSKMGAKHYEKYPRCLLTVHNIAVRNFNRLNKAYNLEAFAKTYNVGLETVVGKYCLICPNHPSQIVDEAMQQQHCVAAYIDSVIEGQCNIVFMRESKHPEKSLITIEIQNNHVVKANGYLNREPTEHEMKIINMYEQYLQGVA